MTGSGLVRLVLATRIEVSATWSTATAAFDVAELRRAAPPGPPRPFRPAGALPPRATAPSGDPRRDRRPTTTPSRRARMPPIADRERERGAAHQRSPSASPSSPASAASVATQGTETDVTIA